MVALIPIIALDIDGVFSPMLKDEHLDDAREFYRWDLMHQVWPMDEETGVFPLVKTNCMDAYVARPVAEYFREVHEAGRARVMWHSSWGSMAKRFEHELGLPDFEVLYGKYSGSDDSGRWGKLVDVEALLARGEKVIWLDDHIVADGESSAVLGNPDLFWIAPGPGDLIGLTLNHLAMIDKVLDFWSR